MNNYSNLRNDDGSEKAPNERRINVSSEDLIKKKESYWFLALVLTLLVIGTVVFYCAHTGVSVPAPASLTFNTIEIETTTSAPQRYKKLLHQDSEFEYFKVAVSNGTRLLGGKVSETCEEVGMKAVCSGGESCKYTNLDKCVVTPLSTDCNNPMYPLSKLLCNGEKPRKCDEFEGVFSFMHNWYGGECGRVGYDWCANGDDFVAGTLESGPGRSQGQVETYYGYCAKKIE